MRRRRASVLALAMCTLLAEPTRAATVAWTSWQRFDASTATGRITVGESTTEVRIDVGSAGFAFVQSGGEGTYYWTEVEPALRPYTGGAVANAPPTPDIVALNKGGPKTITFSPAVTNPYIALLSWNGNTVRFSAPFEKVSEGCGEFGCGTFSLRPGNSFYGDDEPHGIIRFLGTFSSITFTDTTEDWHGLTVGIDGVAPTVAGTGRQRVIRLFRPAVTAPAR